MANFSLIPENLSPEERAIRMAVRTYELEVTYGLTYKDGRYVKAPPFEDYVAAARKRLGITE